MTVYDVQEQPLAAEEQTQEACIAQRSFLEALISMTQQPDVSKLPTLVDGPCPACGWDRGRREVIDHAVSDGRRLRRYGWCAQCGRTEVLWDAA